MQRGIQLVTGLMGLITFIDARMAIMRKYKFATRLKIFFKIARKEREKNETIIPKLFKEISRKKGQRLHF